MEAHSGLSARIAQEAGFPAIWASGLAVSAAMGVRDSNEASWTQVLEVAEFMADATDVPILLDGDTGFGDFNTLRRVVRKLEQRGVAGVAVEDKRFPKRNSFADGPHPLLPVEEFCGKVRAALDAAGDDDFVVVARTEALIAGCGVDEALRRAEAYHRAGAHAVLVHSKKTGPDEVFAFLDAWEDRAPVILVPTTYFTTPTEAFRERGVSAVIWANHLLRASLRAMQETAARVRADGTVRGVEDRLAPLSEVFRLQGAEELRRAEKRYRATGGTHEAVVLAATRGQPLGELTLEAPKTMVRIGGRPILERAVEALRSRGVERTTVVVGYRREAVTVAGVETVENPRWDETGELVSLEIGLEEVEGPLLVLFGDVLFKPYLLDLLLDTEGEAVILAEADPEPPGDGRESDYVVATRSDHPTEWGTGEVRLVRAWTGRWSEEADGEWPGLLRLSAVGVGRAKAWIRSARERDDFDTLQVTDLLDALSDDPGVRIRYVRGHWADLDRLPDLDLPEAW